MSDSVGSVVERGGRLDVQCVFHDGIGARLRDVGGSIDETGVGRREVGGSIDESGVGRCEFGVLFELRSAFLDGQGARRREFGGPLRSAGGSLAMGGARLGAEGTSLAEPYATHRWERALLRSENAIERLPSVDGVIAYARVRER